MTEQETFEVALWLATWLAGLSLVGLVWSVVFYTKPRGWTPRRKRRKFTLVDKH